MALLLKKFQSQSHLINILNKELKKKINIYDFLFFALLGTICDLMPLRHSNKHISKIALNKFNKIENPGIKQLLNFLSLKRSVSYTDISYSIGPMINSPGRLKSANLSVELFCSTHLGRIKKIIQEIQFLNIDNSYFVPNPVRGSVKPATPPVLFVISPTI